MPLQIAFKQSRVTLKKNIIHLMSAPEGNSEFCFPESLNVSRDEVEGKQNSLFPSGADIKYFVI